MGRNTNPFEELYVSETIPAAEFVKLFSPFLISQVAGLFQRGNVVLTGVAGSGKSMLLSLLKANIRMEYAKAREPFPVPAESARFLSCGINLRSSNALRFGRRRVHPDPDIDQVQAPLLFADYINCWLVRDLLRTLRLFAGPEAAQIHDQLHLDSSETKQARFSTAFSSHECWFGALRTATTISDLIAQMDERIRQYTAYFNFNVAELPPSIVETKTEPGIPVSAVAVLLRECGIIHQDTMVFAQIDQYEEILQMWSGPSTAPETSGTPPRENLRATRLSEIVHSMLGSRDDAVFYRVGTRPYALGNDLRLHGSQVRLERAREYEIIDIDKIVRRQENSRLRVFPSLAEDVLTRRLRLASVVPVATKGSMLQRMFGKRESAPKRAESYVSRASRDAERVPFLRLADLSPQWKELLSDLARVRPYEAKLADAWARQKGAARQRRRRDETPRDGATPWLRIYWQKERREQALLQIAASCQQRPIWGGVEDIMALSGGNILVFVSLCRHIWNAYARHHGDDASAPVTLAEPIDVRLQSSGIEQASLEWYEKLRELPGGSERQRFLRVICRKFRQDLLDDRAMSNPGHNGFSLTLEDLEAASDLREFLRTAVGYGDLFERPHTTKLKDRKQRMKWYVKPVLSPHFLLPVSHIKEPKYVSASEVRAWRAAAEFGDERSREVVEDADQHELDFE